MTSIQLIDKVSAPINNMVSALDNVCSVFYSVEKSMNESFDTSKIKLAKQSITVVQEQLVKLAQEQDNYTEAVERSVKKTDGLLGKIGKFAAAYASVQTVIKAIGTSDMMTQTTARLNMMNDGLQTTEELQQMIYQSAQRSRGSYQGSADAVAKMGIMGKDAFKSNAELIAFTEQLNKQFAIAGTSQDGINAAMLQLTQAMSSGVLRGEELNSVFEQAPTIIQAIAKYLDAPIGSIRSMAAEGQLTADIVKNALLSATEETNAKFESMPMTWSQIWTSIKNTALMKFQPVLTKINEMANNKSFQTFANNAVNSLSTVALCLANILNATVSVGNFIGENWSIISPIIYGIIVALAIYAGHLAIVKGMELASATAKGILAGAQFIYVTATALSTRATISATAAQMGLNGALYACPITWIAIAIVALIAIIYALCAAIAKWTGVANTGFGVITGGVNVTIQFFKNLGLAVANVFIGIGYSISALCSNMITAFHNAICNIQSFFYGLLATGLSVIEGICVALNKLPFIEFDYSGISAKADEYAKKSQTALDSKREYQSIGDAFNKGFNTFDTFQDGWVSNAFNMGASWGDGVMDKTSDFLSFGGNGIASGYDDMDNIPVNIAETAGNTGSMADSMDITGEDLKYLRDIAETDVINRFTTAEIKVDMGGIVNNVSSDMDLDGMVDYLATGVNEAMEKIAEGVHE